MHYEWHGSQADSAPVLVFSSGLGGSAHYWKGQLAALGKDYRILLYDHAGTGRSPATLPDDYSIEHMADELLTLLASLSVSRCDFVGHALGGLVGLVLAKTQPALINNLVVVNAWSQPGTLHGKLRSTLLECFMPLRRLRLLEPLSAVALTRE